MICSGASYNERVTALHLVICIHESTASGRPHSKPPSLATASLIPAWVAVPLEWGKEIKVLVDLGSCSVLYIDKEYYYHL